VTREGEAGGTHAHLVYMANQIARNFETMGDGAAKATADHIASFWDPRMKAAIWDDPDGLSPVASAAFALLRAQGAPPAQTRATKFGDDRSDAG
jgi:formate dehydrogenase subunit delta